MHLSPSLDSDLDLLSSVSKFKVWNTVGTKEVSKMSC